ncbi:MAG TPA: phosphatase PAP2 family protein [Polyangiaceae bacterium]|nr:phosphatase PAP2 family protein [Polyangiaceae bacterium]
MDERLLIAINALRAPWLDVWMAPLAKWGIYVLPALMLLSLTKGSQHARSVRDGWLTWFLSIFVAETVLKPMIARPRPTGYAHLRELLEVMGRTPPPTSLAFPSGTATAAFAGATWIWLRWGIKPGLPAVLFACLVGFSRVYGAVHWPSDILGGAVLGAAVAVGLDWVSARLELLPRAR